ncbi:MAG: hypothetical protein ACHQUA_02380 [Microgenomates group bacterium]
MSFEQNSVVEDHKLKSRKLVFEIKVTSNATPASKKHSSDLPGICILSTEGLTAALVAIEAVSGLTNYTAPNDVNGIMDVMLKGSELGSIKKVQSIRVSEKVSAGFSAPTVQALGTAQGLTAGGNIAFEIDSATDFSAADATFVCEVDYLLSE